MAPSFVPITAKPTMNASTPRITALRAVPVAGRDSMLMNLSGAHGPFFTRNLLVLTDSAGRTGVGEVPGGEKIRATLEDAAPLLIGQPIGKHLALLESVRKTNRCVCVEEGYPRFSVTSELAAEIMTHAFDYLDAPVARVAGKDVPMPYAANLEKLALPNADEVVAAVKGVVYA